MYKNCIKFSYLKITLLMVFAYFLFIPSSVKATEDSYIIKTVPAPSVTDDADASYRCVWKYDSGNQEMARFHLYTASTDLLDLRGVTKILAPYSYHSAFYNYYGTDLKPEVYLVFSNGEKQAFTDGVWESDTPLNTSACIYYKYYAADYYWHPKSGANRDFNYASFSVSDLTLYVDEKYKPIGFFVGSLSDTDKTSPCEVVADINYAYYVSFPATLTLEPADLNKDLPTWKKVFSRAGIVFNDSELKEYLTEMYSEPDFYTSNFSIKAKTTTEGLGNKYISVYTEPTEESKEGLDEETIESLTDAGPDLSIKGAAILRDVEDSSKLEGVFITQDTVYFGNSSNKFVAPISSSKWSSISGLVGANIEDQGCYKGNFNFVYGLVDADTAEIPD